MISMSLDQKCMVNIDIEEFREDGKTMGYSIDMIRNNPRHGKSEENRVCEKQEILHIIAEFLLARETFGKRVNPFTIETE